MTPGKVLTYLIAVFALIGLCGDALYTAYNHGVTVINATRDAEWSQAVATQKSELARAVQAVHDQEQRFQREANQVGIDAREKTLLPMLVAAA